MGRFVQQSFPSGSHRIQVTPLPPYSCAKILAMKFLRTRRRSGRKTEPVTLSLPSRKESTLLKTVGWVSAGLGAVALGLVVGNEIRQRYKFNRRTPYDNYAHSGDVLDDMESGIGI